MRFMVTHTMEPGLSRDAAIEIQKATQQDPDVRGYRSFVSLTAGKTFCLYDAPTHDNLIAWLRKLALPYESIVQIEMEGEGADLADVPALANVRL